VRRYLEKRPIFSPDRGHVHHRLLELGLTQRRAVMVLYGVSVALASCAILISLGGSWTKCSALLIATLVLVALTRRTGYFEYLHHRGRNEARIYDALSERLRRAMPELLSALHAAEVENEAFRVLRRTVGDAGCAAIEVVHGDAVVRRFPDGADSQLGAVKRSFPLGPDRLARARVDFSWGPDDSGPTTQATILLQLVVDGVAASLGRCGSPLSPAEAPVLESMEQPAAVVVALTGSSRL
jgi:UDP-GlcNAc:undecaprenyl-phosphate/decaprenyl-phosphate GlcNAc-1-phosphate transferase